MSKKAFLAILHVFLFLLLEDLCATRIIWHYDWSKGINNCLLIVFTLNAVFDAGFIYFKLIKKEPLSRGERIKTIIEAVISLQFLIILFLMVLFANLKLKVAWLVILIQIMVLGTRTIICFATKDKLE